MAAPYVPAATPILITISITAFFVILLAVATTIKLARRKNSIVLSLSAGIYCIAGAIISRFIGYLDWFFSQPQYFPHEPHIYVYSGPITYTFVVLSVPFWTWFANLVFRWKKIYLVASIMVLVAALFLIWHPANHWGEEALAEASIRPITQAYIFAYFGGTVLRISRASFTGAKRASVDSVRDNFVDIGRGMFLGFGSFLLLLFSAVLTVAARWDQNPFLLAAWPCILTALYFLYRGAFLRKVYT